MSHTKLRPNVRSPSAQMRRAEMIYRRLFAITPAPLLVWTPDFRVADATDVLLAMTGKTRDAIVGLPIAEAFPGNPDDPTGGGIAPTIASFQRVLRTGRKDVMPIVRHDVTREDGAWEERHWLVTNSTIVDDDGSVLAIVEHAIDARNIVEAQSMLPLDHLADTLIQAFRSNEQVGDIRVKASLEQALIQIGHRLAAREKAGEPQGLLN